MTKYIFYFNHQIKYKPAIRYIFVGSTLSLHYCTTSSPNKTFINAAQGSAKKLEKDNKRKAIDEKSLRRECKYTKLQDTPALRGAYN